MYDHHIHPLHRPVLIASAGSTGLIIGALLFEYAWGLAPCDMCIWQRVPHLGVMILAIGWMTYFSPAMDVIYDTRIPSVLIWLMIGALGLTGGLGIFHAGIEYGWWSGVTHCTASGQVESTIADLERTLAAAPIVRCDEAPWTLWGLSLAGYNAVFSFVLCGVLIWGVVKHKTPHKTEGLSR